MTNCLEEESLATHGQNVLQKFRAAYITLENNESTLPGQPDAAMLKQEMQRFQLWATNLGLYRHDHGSLDYRLRDNGVIKSFTRELLISLDESLEEIEEITTISSTEDQNPSSMSSDVPSPDALIIGNDEPSSTSSDRGHSASFITMGTLNNADDENESLLNLHLEDVTEAINQMYNLASQIRSPKSRNVRTDVDLYKEVAGDIKSEYIKMRKNAELQGIEQNLLQSRNSFNESHDRREEIVLTPEDHCLIKRLQKANHTRRQQFEYWRRSKTRSIQAAFKAVEPLPNSRSQDRRLENVITHDTPSLAQHSEATPSVLSSVVPLPKNFVLRDSKSTYSGTSRGLTVHGPSGEKVDWPKPPAPSPLKGDFECPFCFYLCNPRCYENAAWRSHLKHDLRPYVCTYDQCPEPNVLYDSWEEWTRHEQWTHQQRIWRCLEHPQHEYVHLAAYEDHVRTYHAESALQMLSSELLKSRESVSQECDRPCPFCQRDFERPHDMQHHLAGHLEIIALLSLPNLNDIDNNTEAGKVESNEANRNYAESKADDFDRTVPLVFRDNDGSEAITLATKTDRELFERSLKAENISFKSRNETTIEAHESYSKEIVGKWLSELPYQERSTTWDWPPVSIENHDFSDAFEYFDPSESTEEQGSIHHWLPHVFSQGRPVTPLEVTGQTSVLLGPHMPGSVARLSESYTKLLEIPFEYGDFLVGIYQRSHDARSRILCRTAHPHILQTFSTEPLVALSIGRSGPFLELFAQPVTEKNPNLWARLKFSNYEGLVLFFCAFLALRSEDIINPVKELLDYELEKETERFAGRIVDDDYEHALRLFQERDTGVLRLQASVVSGVLKRKPIWTAFITQKMIRRFPRTWASPDSPRVFYLTDLQQYIFSKDYSPPKTSSGDFELTFIGVEDATEFATVLNDLRKNIKGRMRR